MRGIIRESAAKRLLAAPGPVEADVEVATELETVASNNVVGILKGAKEPDEYVLYTAHWDAFGRCRPGATDEICNGAIDNASGTAGLLELARAFASGPRPDRSIVFLFTTAEELELAGSRQYARTPVVPLARTVAAFNLDVIALVGRGNTVGFVGAGLTDADSVFARLAGCQGRTLDTGPLTRMVLRSSDAWSLLMAGVPAFILSGAIGNGADGKNAAFREYLATRYHGPGDELLDGLPMGGAVEEVELLYEAGMHFARAGTDVRFVPGSPFQRRERR
jgi:Zn-dependent M28 family amino/carboxypeptidase